MNLCIINIINYFYLDKVFCSKASFEHLIFPLCLPSAEIMGMYHHAQVKFLHAYTHRVYVFVGLCTVSQNFNVLSLSACLLVGPSVSFCLSFSLPSQR